MITKKVLDLLNVQIGKEGFSSNLYLSMASWAQANGFSGVAKWMYAQAEEERMHMLKIVNYVNDRGEHAVIPEMEKPQYDFNSIQEVFNQTLEHEQFITNSINEIVAATEEEKDFTTHNWIQWFVTEQIEEEAQVNDILDKLKLIGDGNLYMFDRDIMSLRSEEGADSL
jgi:ferritin